MQEIGMDLPKARESLFQKLGRAPTAREVADHLNLTTDEVLEAVDAARMYRLGSLSAPLAG
jgi:RNA polymerase sigma-B factor